MFLGSDIIEFINKIINSNEIKEDEILNNLKEFSNYLRLTKMADEETLKFLNQTLDCLPELIKLKKKTGYLDVSILFKKENNEKQEKNKTKTKKKEPQKVYEEKHYHNYHYNTSSSSCGGSGGSRSGC